MKVPITARLDGTVEDVATVDVAGNGVCWAVEVMAVERLVSDPVYAHGVKFKGETSEVTLVVYKCLTVTKACLLRWV